MQGKRTQIKGIAARAGHWSATHRGKAIGLWIALVVVALVAGGAVGQRTLTDSESGVGSSKAANVPSTSRGRRAAPARAS